MKGILVQFLATIIISLANFYTGFSLSWSSYTLEIFKSDESPLGNKITKYEENLIGSMPMLGCMVATLFGGFVAEAIGRKKTEVLCGLCFVLATAIIATARNITLILAGRFISGLGNGVHLIVMLVYINEYSQTAIRGTLTSMPFFAYVFGGLVSYIMGWLCSYDVTNYSILTLCVVYVLLVLYLKESPTYLLGRGRAKEALNSLKFYRGTSNTTTAILEEISYLQNQQSVSNKNSDLELSEKTAEYEKLRQGTEEQQLENDLSAWKILCTSKSTQRAMVIISGHIILSVLMGTIAVQAYAAQLFAATVPYWSPHVCSVLLAIAMVVGSGISMMISDLVGRRVLFIASCILTSVTLVLLASLLRWAWAPDWSVPFVILLNNCCFLCGAGNVPYVQLGETFIPKLKSLTTTIATCCMWLSNFVVLALYGPSIDTIGLEGTFLVFGIVAAIASVTGYYFMKETKGVSLEEIQEMYDEGYLYRQTNK